MHGNNEGFCNGLMCCLLQAFVDQLRRNSNPQYDYGELNLCLALAYMVNQRVYSFVAGKLGFILMQHTIIIFASNRTPSFINLTSYEAVESLCGNLIRVKQDMGDCAPIHHLQLVLMLPIWWRVPYFRGRYLDRGLNFGWYWHFCGTIIIVCTFENP